MLGEIDKFEGAVWGIVPVRRSTGRRQRLKNHLAQNCRPWRPGINLRHGGKIHQQRAAQPSIVSPMA